MSIIDKGRLALQVYKMKKAVEDQSYQVDENGILVDVAGFMAMSEPKIKKLVVNGVENKMLLEMINKALKKSTEASMKKMQELGKDLEGAM
jgi:DNA-binding protein YbaB